MVADGPKAAKKLAKAAKREQGDDGKSAEREQKLLWDADKIQLKWVRIAILMAGIGFGADRTLHELTQGGAPAAEILVLRSVAQALAVLGMVALAVATFQHGRMLSAVRRSEPIPVARFPLSLIVSVLIVILGVIVLAVATISLGAAGRQTAVAPFNVVAAGTVVVAEAATVAASPSLTPAVPSQVAAAAPVLSSGVAAAPASATAVPFFVSAATPTLVPMQSVATQTPVKLAVQGTGPAGARLREAPVDGGTVAVLADGTQLTALDDSTSAGGQLWQRVRTADDREGWIAADLVVTVDSPAGQP